MQMPRVRHVRGRCRRFATAASWTRSVEFHHRKRCELFHLVTGGVRKKIAITRSSRSGGANEVLTLVASAGSCWRIGWRRELEKRHPITKQQGIETGHPQILCAANLAQRACAVRLRCCTRSPSETRQNGIWIPRVQIRSAASVRIEGSSAHMDLTLSQLYRSTRRHALSRENHVWWNSNRGKLERNALSIPGRQICAESTRQEGLEKHESVSCELNAEIPPSTMSWSALESASTPLDICRIAVLGHAASRMGTQEIYTEPEGMYPGLIDKRGGDGQREKRKKRRKRKQGPYLL
ncbi:hypothetical protein M431DRAFT_509311 [Trichoderma harzianum CBS 226.95]|uniref:Uncharacterized protein n=1 Tax=Trichoderma harzianum CBS 226.95 TaxID=983964 RepID=A0A2T4AB60_TRIHA|nr:hypothetical protein M431DRAFT_509311 [Trichoderma harzianum CBS 226.95]PTB54310.1 hypothetical protein M431DRAFT_509311 [Trichoderma harzianum CBS 226.95]